MSPEKPVPAVAPDTELPGGGNIDNIREILFGAQMRQYEKRFQRIEELMARDSRDLRDEVERRLVALETFVKQEYEAVGERIVAEHEERGTAVRDLGKEVAAGARELDKRSTRLEEKLGKGLKDLREKLLEQSKSLTTEMRERNDVLSTALTAMVDELRAEKADRAALASLFTEMAMRLNEEFRLPDGRK